MGSVKRTALDFGNVVDVAADADARHVDELESAGQEFGGRGKGEVPQPAKKRRTDEKEKLGKVERCD